MNSAGCRILYCAVTCLLLTTAFVSADYVENDWTFTEAANYLGWTKSTCPYISSIGVDAGYLWAITSGTEPWILGPDNIGTAALPNQYVSIKMRMHISSGPKDRFGPTEARMYFSTTADTNLANRCVLFKTYGNAEWKTYNIRMGGHTGWIGNIKRLRFQFCSQSDARVEIAWIRLIQDRTPPEYKIHNMWNPKNNDYVTTNTPTITLRDVYEEASGFECCFFYYRPAASTSDADWIQVGVDDTWTHGYQFTYPELPNGCYDFGVRLRDKVGNFKQFPWGPDYFIDNVTIDTNQIPRISVDAGNVLGAMPKEIPGNNTVWVDFTDKYDPATGKLTPALEALVSDMMIGNMRYAGSDEFEWKDSIGPVELRPTQLFSGTARVPKFGIDEFLRYCETHDIEPILGVKVRWPGAPGMQPIEGDDPYAKCLQDAIDLVEYCNTPNDGSNPNGDTDWAAVRAANGHPEPYNVKWFEFGNEPWGYDTYGSPSRYGYTLVDAAGVYGVAYLNYMEGMTAVDPSIIFAATTYHRLDYTNDWTSPDWAIVVHQMNGSRTDVVQTHPYFPYSAWQTNLDELYKETMATPKYLDEYISMQRHLMKLTSPETADRKKLRIDEWNINYNWIYDPSVGRINTWHTKTLKAAVAAADALRVFIENRDIVESTGWWHIYRGGWECISSDDTTVQPIYHVFRIYKNHFGDDLVDCAVHGSPRFDFTKLLGGVIPAQYGVPHITAIASKSADGQALYLMVMNAHKTDAIPVEVLTTRFVGEPWTQLAAEIWELNGPDVDDYLHPENIKITVSSANFSPAFTYSFPAHSVTSFKFTQSLALVDNIPDLGRWADDTRVVLGDKVVSRKLAPDLLYAEEPSRIAGIRVEVEQTDAEAADSIIIRGKLATTAYGERYIAAESVEPTIKYGILSPWSMNLKSLATEPPLTTGLLVQVWGVSSGSISGSFFIDDGSGVGPIKVYSDAVPGDGVFVRVVGVKSLEEGTAGHSVPVILTSSSADVTPVL